MVLGIGIGILRPGEPNCTYPGEGAQEDFVVLVAYARLAEDKPISCPEEFRLNVEAQLDGAARDHASRSILPDDD